MNAGLETFGSRLNTHLTVARLEPLDPAVYARFESYCSLILRWNARVNLSAIRDEDGILSRHFVESIACARAIPSNVATLLDFGSGAGFPGIPIAMCRPEVSVTLAESQGKKAAFLQEALRVLALSAVVHPGRAEALAAEFDCVTLRAVDRMPQAVEVASHMVRPGGWLALMTTGAEFAGLQSAAGADYSWSKVAPLAGSVDRVLALGQRAISSPA